MGLLENSMKSTQTGSKVFKQVSPHDGNEKKSFQVRLSMDARGAEICSAPATAAWHFLRNGDTSPLGDTTRRFLFFSADDGLQMVAKKCAEQISFLSSGAECQGCETTL